MLRRVPGENAPGIEPFRDFGPTLTPLGPVSTLGWPPVQLPGILPGLDRNRVLGKNRIVIRIVALVLGLAIAGGAIFFLASGDSSALREVAPPLDDIDDASRKALERVLEAADR